MKLHNGITSANDFHHDLRDILAQLFDTPEGEWARVWTMRHVEQYHRQTGADMCGLLQKLGYGYMPEDTDWLPRFLMDSGVSEKLMLETGLIMPRGEPARDLCASMSGIVRYDEDHKVWVPVLQLMPYSHHTTDVAIHYETISDPVYQC